MLPLNFNKIFIAYTGPKLWQQFAKTSKRINLYSLVQIGNFVGKTVISYYICCGVGWTFKLNVHSRRDYQVAPPPLSALPAY